MSVGVDPRGRTAFRRRPLSTDQFAAENVRAETIEVGIVGRQLTNQFGAGIDKQINTGPKVIPFTDDIRLNYLFSNPDPVLAIGRIRNSNDVFVGGAFNFSI